MTLNVANGGGLVAGSYPLIGYNPASLTGGTGAFTTVNLPSGDTFSFTASGSVIDLVIPA